LNNEELHEHSAGIEFRSHDAAKILRRHRARKRLLIIITSIFVFVAGYWYLNRSFSVTLHEVLSFGNAAERSVLDTLGKTFSAPPPLRVPVSKRTKSAQVETLTRAGVVAQTNLQRKANGDFPPLAGNELLDAVATLRLNDIFEKQYFAHVAPNGATAETVAKTVGYQYLSLGENLALGIFSGDKGVVDAWMESPGHRANILETHNTQIGVAVRKGVFEGQTTWIAVQIFGRPASDCPPPDASLKTAIEAGQKQLSEMAANLKRRRDEMDMMEAKQGSAYNQKVDEYNAVVADYNNLLAQTKAQIAQYNSAAKTFNSCISS
jgi:uncharacterized protein YkwD